MSAEAKEVEEVKEETGETIPRAVINQALADDRAALMHAAYAAVRRHDPSVEESTDGLDIKLTSCVKKSDPPSGWIKCSIMREGTDVSHQVDITFGKHDDGRICRIWEIQPEDMDAVLAQDATLSLKDNDGFDDTVLRLSGGRLSIRNVDVEKTPAWGRPRYIPMPEYATSAQDAIVFLREDGTVQAGIIDIRTNHLWLARSYTFDEPTWAMRKIQASGGSDVEAYRHKGGDVARLVYKSGVGIPRKDDDYPLHSAWVPMRVRGDFARIRDLAKYALDNPDFTCLETRLNQLNADFNRAFTADKLEEAVAAGAAYLDTPHCNQGQKTPCGTYMGDTVMHYQMACALAKLAQNDAAMQHLAAIECKWQHWSLIQKDTDFDGMRSREDFAAMMSRHLS